ncbi:MAG: family 1 encapsulin nanocompartment shell protein [Fervidicoccaceae archaeon]
MLSKHPLELPPKRQFSREEIMEALRLNIIAELDAVNLYEQLANYTSDDNVRKVLLDIAKEEKTHAGEFLALLKSLDPEQVAELATGAEEVKKLTGISAEDPPISQAELGSRNGTFLEGISKKVLDAAEGARFLRNILPVLKLGRGTEFVQVVSSNGELKFSQLHEISLSFSIKQRELDFWKKTRQIPELVQAQNAGIKLAILEDDFILRGSEKEKYPGLLTCESVQKLQISDWSQPNNSVADAALAIGALFSKGAPRPYALLLSPRDYANLLRHTERTGVSDLQRIKEIFDRVVMIPSLEEGKAVALSLNSVVADIVLGGDTEVDEVGPREDEVEYRVWETILLRIKYPAGIVVLEKK